MSTLTRGSCLCGDVAFEVEGELEHFFLCHCGYCRKDTGSAHAANLFSTTATLRWVAGQDRVTVYQLPGTRHVRSFCSRCGAALPSVQADGRLVVVPAGSLDDKVPLRPDAHIFYASKADWDQDLEGIPKLPGSPAEAAGERAPCSRRSEQR